MTGRRMETHGHAPLLVGHRGAGRHAPENTLAGIRYALDAGYDGVELDVRLTADGVPALFHDDTLERVTDGVGLFTDASLDSLKTLDAGKRFDVRYAGEPVPSLEEGLQTIAGRLITFLELKTPDTVEPVGAALSAADAASWCIPTSFSTETIRFFSGRFPSFTLALLLHPEHEETGPLLERPFDLPASMIGLSPRTLSSDRCERIRRAGKKILTGPVDTEPELDAVLRFKPDFILSNWPDLILEHLRERV